MGCTFCNYDLSGNISGICPECGRPVFRYTDRAREVIAEANRQAVLLFSKGDPLLRPARWWLPQSVTEPEIRTSHILLGIAGGPQGVGYHALLSCGVEPGRLRDAVVSRMPRCARHPLSDGVRLPLSSSSKNIIKVAIEDAAQLGHSWVGTEHLLLALCRQSEDRAAKRALAATDVNSDRVRAFIVANMAAVSAGDAP